VVRPRARARKLLRGVNAALARTTGYRLVYGRTPRDVDQAAQAIIESVEPFTMTDPEKLYALITAVRYVHDHEIEGDVVECGVWRGGSMQAAALTLLDRHDTTRDLYLFDTFTGMTPPSARDRWVTGEAAEEMLAVEDSTTSGFWARASLDSVKEGFSSIPYPPERVHYVVGDVEATIPAQAPERISVLRLDTDWYASTKHELAHLFPRLSRGGVLIIDDYGHWQGAREATDEFLRETAAPLLLVRVSDARVAVKL
jgi:O-methyltransferase